VSELVLEQALVEVVTLDAEFRWMGEFLEEFFYDWARLALLLKKAEDLINLVGDDISILVFLVFVGSPSLSLGLRVVFPVLINLYFFILSSLLSNILFFIANRVSHLKVIRFWDDGGGFAIKGQHNGRVGVRLAALKQHGLDVGLIFGLAHLSILLKIAGGISCRQRALLAEAEGIDLWGVIVGG
jgi:hypothetical protein